MAQPTNRNLFNYTELTDRERVEGSILNDLQLVVIKNQIIELSELLLTLTYEPKVSFEIDSAKYIQRQAELVGQINMLKYLISLHDAAKEQTQIWASSNT